MLLHSQSLPRLYVGSALRDADLPARIPRELPSGRSSPSTAPARFRATAHPAGSAPRQPCGQQHPQPCSCSSGPGRSCGGVHGLRPSGIIRCYMWRSGLQDSLLLYGPLLGFRELLPFFCIDLMSCKATPLPQLL